MMDIISYDTIEGWVRALNQAFGINIPEKITAILFFIVVAILIIFCFFKFILNPYLRNCKWRKKQLNVILKGYGNYISREQRRLYIDTWLQESPPNEHEEPSLALSHESSKHTNAIRFFIKEVLRENIDHSPYYCILGGSGMGKSTFVVNLVWKYIENYNEKNLPYPIKLINCGDINPLTDYINKIVNKENTILILDALDENNEAIDNYNEFLKQLLNSIINFRIVIITCRTQFFEKFEDELNIISKQTHNPSTKGPKHFQKYYVSPFNSDEVSNYLRKKYLLKVNYRAYKKAKNIVKNCNKLMARPLLLSYIDDLLNSDIEEFDYSIAYIYEIIIDKWLELEANFVTTTPDEKEEYKKKLLDFSYDMALCLAKPSFEQSEVEAIIKQYSEEQFIKERYLKGRSLLNRNSKNNYKFAHKSFMEYLVAKQLFEQKGTIELESVDCKANDMIPIFLTNLIKYNYPPHNNLCYSVSLGQKFSYSFNNNYWNLSVLHEYLYDSHGFSPHNCIFIKVLSDFSDNIHTLLVAFIKFFCYYYSERSSSTIELLITCERDFIQINNVISEVLGLHHAFHITYYIYKFEYLNNSVIDFISKLIFIDKLVNIDIVFITCLTIPSSFMREMIFTVNNSTDLSSLLSSKKISFSFISLKEHEIYTFTNIDGHYKFINYNLLDRIPHRDYELLDDYIHEYLTRENLHLL